MLIHAAGDERIPSEFSEELYDRAAEPRKLVLLPGGHHRSAQHDSELQGMALRWMTRALQRARGAASAYPPPRSSGTPPACPAEIGGCHDPAKVVDRVVHLAGDVGRTAPAARCRSRLPGSRSLRARRHRQRWGPNRCRSVWRGRIRVRRRDRTRGRPQPERNRRPPASPLEATEPPALGGCARRGCDRGRRRGRLLHSCRRRRQLPRPPLPANRSRPTTSVAATSSSPNGTPLNPT